MEIKEQVKSELVELVRAIKLAGEPNYDADVSRIVRETLKNWGMKRAVIGLNTAGCSYRRKGAGCFHCGHLKGYQNPAEMFGQFINDVDEIFGVRPTDICPRG